MTRLAQDVASKVAPVTVLFWATKICATTLGETGGDTVSMTLGLGYLAATGVFLLVFLTTLTWQLAARRYDPVRYWLVILSTTTAGTTLSDFLDRSAHLGYLGGGALLLALLLAVLVAWKLAAGRVSFDHVVDPRVEGFYWLAILVSNTLGTALGDFTADDLKLGFGGGALVFGALLAVVLALFLLTSLPRALLFWTAFVLTRPLGAVLGDALTKGRDQGGLALGPLPASLVLAAAVVGLVALSARRSDERGLRSNSR
ncbi:MAG: hypothetical protein INR64_03775 [Caulobacteraceae bacterium]|nr:hypothetical protein [Caulobacter sp.]